MSIVSPIGWCHESVLVQFPTLFVHAPAGHWLAGDARGGTVGPSQHERAAVAAPALARSRGLSRQLPGDAGLR